MEQKSALIKTATRDIAPAAPIRVDMIYAVLDDMVAPTKADEPDHGPEYEEVLAASIGFEAAYRVKISGFHC